jgi:hypothetical protein
MHPSMLSHSQSMPAKQSYSINPVFHNARNTPSWTHSWKRSWAVEPGQNLVASRAFHWQPVRSTKRMASMHTRSGVRGLPPPKRCVFTCSGRCIAISGQSASGMRQSSGTGFVSMVAPGNDSQLSGSKCSCTQTL